MERHNGYRVYSPNGRTTIATTVTHTSPTGTRGLLLLSVRLRLRPARSWVLLLRPSLQLVRVLPSTVVRYDNYGTYYGDYGYPTG